MPYSPVVVCRVPGTGSPLAEWGWQVMLPSLQPISFLLFSTAHSGVTVRHIQVPGQGALWLTMIWHSVCFAPHLLRHGKSLQLLQELQDKSHTMLSLIGSPWLVEEKALHALQSCGTRCSISHLSLWQAWPTSTGLNSSGMGNCWDPMNRNLANPQLGCKIPVKIMACVLWPDMCGCWGEAQIPLQYYFNICQGPMLND